MSAAPLSQPQDSHQASSSLSSSRLTKARSTLQYLANPATSPPGSAPSSLRTRTLLRSARYITIFLFWRLVRYAKYAVTGAVIAAVSGTIIGSVASGAAFVLAPTGILGGAGAGLIWAVAKFGWRRAERRIKMGTGPGRSRRDMEDPRGDERASAKGEDGVGGTGRDIRAERRVERGEPW